MTEAQYPPTLELEINIPTWLEFVWDAKYPKKSYHAKSKLKGTPYWRYTVKKDGIEQTWWIYSEELDRAVDRMLQEQRDEGRPERLAVLKIEEDNKHYHGLATPDGFLQTCLPNHAVPERLSAFVGNNVAPKMGGGPPTPQLPQAPPPTSLPPPTFDAKEAMKQAVKDSLDVWLLEIENCRKSVKELGEIGEEQYEIVKKVAIENIGATAHYLFRARANGRV